METAITLDFGDGTYRFHLPMAQIVEIERLCGDKSIIAMYDEMGMALGIGREDGEPVFVGGGSARIRDVYEVIRCGAIGGRNVVRNGQTHVVSPLDAKQLADRYVDGRPLGETIPVAWAILNAAIMGVQVKKKVTPSPESDPGLSEKDKS